jgi:hypothetical protein
MEIHVIGIDLGKTVFHLVGVDSSGTVVVRKRCRAFSCWTIQPTYASIGSEWRRVAGRIFWVGPFETKAMTCD